MDTLVALDPSDAGVLRELEQAGNGRGRFAAENGRIVRVFLRGCGLSEVPSGIRRLPALTRLFVTSVPRQGTQLPGLEKLDLRWNEIDERDPAIAPLEARGCRVLL